MQMALSDHDQLTSRQELSEMTTRGNDNSPLHLATAKGEAAGSVFALINQQVPYLLKITGSSTSVSDLGTTVTLEGEYKH